VPIVKSKISGGHVSITMGAGELDKKYQEATVLAARLRGR